jgi:AraC family transcriptional regulator, positive regulator of tynA and feaB
MNLPTAPESTLVRVDGFKGWVGFVRENFPWLEVRDLSREGFRAEVQGHRLGDGVLANMRSASNEVRRTRQLAGRAEAGHVKLMWQIAGSIEIEQDRQSSVIHAGDACVCDTARPYRVAVQEGAHFAVLTLPYNALPGWEAISQQVCGQRLQDGVTARAALAALMALLVSRPEVDPRGTEDVLRAVQWMLLASLRREAQPASVDRDASRLQRAQQYVLAHIGDPKLDPDEVALALHMSRRALYLLLKEYRITPARMIHDLRLERCRDALVDPTQRQRSLTEIAFDNGFSDTGTFSRRFKVQYGITPSECRRQALFPQAQGSH